MRVFILPPHILGSMPMRFIAAAIDFARARERELEDSFEALYGDEDSGHSTETRKRSRTESSSDT